MLKVTKKEWFEKKFKYERLWIWTCSKTQNLLHKIQGWDSITHLFERFACFLWAQEYFAHEQEPITAVAHLSWATWAYRSQLLFCNEQRETSRILVLLKVFSIVQYSMMHCLCALSLRFCLLYAIISRLNLNQMSGGFSCVNFDKFSKLEYVCLAKTKHQQYFICVLWIKYFRPLTH